ncbi:unnamed protein product [Acanthoscelides obtectus]|nr:unnamed protein product [Acanthoscelides obtectus]CAK1655907.1 hypothetical protein AOBTE_LOCUS19430 [Acanthoscelides obtectus]
MVTSGMTFAVHYGCTTASSRSRYHQGDLINDFGGLHIVDRQNRDQPVIYVAVATWIPSCNMYQLQNHSDDEDIDKTVLRGTNRTKQIFEPG